MRRGTQTRAAASLAAAIALLAWHPAAAQTTGRLTLCGDGALSAASPPRLVYRHVFGNAAPGAEIFAVADSPEGVAVYVAVPRAAGEGALTIRRYRIAGEGAPVLQSEFSAAAPAERRLHLMADGAVLVEHAKADMLYRAEAAFLYRSDGSRIDLARQLPAEHGLLRYLGPARAGGFYVLAEAKKRPSESSETAIVVRFDAAGRMLWQTALAPSQPDAHAFAILAERDDGHALVVSPRFSVTAAITLIDPDGRVVRQSRFDPRVEGAWIVPDSLMPVPSPPNETLALFRLTGMVFGTGHYLLAWIAGDAALYGVFAAPTPQLAETLSMVKLVRGRYEGLLGADEKGRFVRYTDSGEELWRHARTAPAEIRLLCALGGRTIAVAGREGVGGDADRPASRPEFLELYRSD